jgi:hypothetical protein
LFTEQYDFDRRIAVLLSMGLTGNQARYTPDQLVYAYQSGLFLGMDAEAKKFIKLVSPAIKQYIDFKKNPLDKIPKGMSFFDKEAQVKEVLTKALDPMIRKERAHAAISSLMVRVLLGADAPKSKYISESTNPLDFKLLSTKVPDSMDIIEAANQYSHEQLTTNAPEIAQAMLVRYLVGCGLMEAKLGNLLYVRLPNGVNTCIPIDTDISFTNTHPQLKDLVLGSTGAQSLLPTLFNDEDTKTYWDALFTQENNEAVTKAMIKIMQRAASVLTDDLINYVVDYVMNTENKTFSLPQEERDHVVNFLRETQKIALEKLKQLGMENTVEEPVAAAPWLKDMMDDIDSKKGQGSSLVI